MEYYYPMHGGNWDWGWGLGMMLIWFLFILILTILVLRVLRSHDVLLHGSKSDPLQIAKERYAKGEITKEDFDQLKKDLVQK